MHQPSLHTNVQRFLTNFFVEFLVELDVTSTGCVALRYVAFCCLLRIALCCVVVLCCCDVMCCDLSLTCYSSLLA